MGEVGGSSKERRLSCGKGLRSDRQLLVATAPMTRTVKREE